MNIRSLALLTAIFLLGSIERVAGQAAGGPRALRGQLTVIGPGAGSPDDVAVGPDDTIYYSDMTANRVMQLLPDGTSVAASPAIQEPEGIAVLPDGTLVVAEQQSNRLYHVDPVTQSMSLFYAVGNKTANAGIDGISWDGITDTLLIPDAPTGRILQLSSDGQKLKVLLTGFRRPTSAVRAVDGSLYVCDEYGNRIYHVAADGTRSVIADITLPDDVILDANGNVLVNSLQGTIWQIDPHTRRIERLVVGLRSPHGIALDSQGNVIIADADLNRIYRLILRSTAL